MSKKYACYARCIYIGIILVIIYLGLVIRFGFIMFDCARVLWYAKSDCVIRGNLGIDCNSIFDRTLADFCRWTWCCVFDRKFKKKKRKKEMGQLNIVRLLQFKCAKIQFFFNFWTKMWMLGNCSIIWHKSKANCINRKWMMIGQIRSRGVILTTCP